MAVWILKILELQKQGFISHFDGAIIKHIETILFFNFKRILLRLPQRKPFKHK